MTKWKKLPQNMCYSTQIQFFWQQQIKHRANCTFEFLVNFSLEYTSAIASAFLNWNLMLLFLVAILPKCISFFFIWCNEAIDLISASSEKRLDCAYCQNHGHRLEWLPASLWGPSRITIRKYVYYVNSWKFFVCIFRFVHVEWFKPSV